MSVSIRAATAVALAGLALMPAVAKAQTGAPTAPTGDQLEIAQPTTPTSEPASAPVMLPPVTVTAGRGSDLDKLDVSTTVISREQIQAMPEISVDQILNRIPGVWAPTIPTNQLHPTAQPFSLRGFGTITTINTLVMVDGVPINDPYFRTLDWSQVPKASIQRIEIIRGGGATSLWGNMAMGGVVNIVTKAPERTGVDIDANFGSYNTTNSETSGGLIVNDKLRAGLSYNRQQSSGYNLTPAQYQNSNLTPTSSQADNVTFSLYYNPSSATKLFAKAYYHQAYEDGLVWSIAHNQWSTYRLLLGASHQFDERSSINFAGWAAGGVFGTINASSGTYSLVNTTRTNQFVSQREIAPNNNQGGSIFYQLDTEHIKDIKIGVDARRIEIADYLNLYANASGNPTQFVSKGEHRMQGVFAQGTWHAGFLPLEVTIGLRGDFYQANGASFQAVTANTFTNIANSSYSSFDPRIGMKYQVVDALALRGAIYRNFSAPGMNQMYRSFAAGTSFTVTNPNLQPMTNFGQEVGVDFAWKGFTLSGTAFNNNMDNFIDFVTICSANAACAAPFATPAGLTGITTVNQYINVGSATFQGIEIIGTWKPVEQVKFTAGFTATNAYMTSSAYPNLIRTGLQIGQVPTWMFNGAVEWRPIEALTLSASLKSFPAYWANTGHTQLNEAATLLDLGASYAFNKSVELYGSVQNVTNVQYLASGYTTTTFEGSTVNNTAIPQLGMPLMAMVGLRARF